MHKRITDIIRSLRITPKNFGKNSLGTIFRKRCSVRFLRRKVIDNYVADFYCYGARLVIEPDGSQHLCKGRKSERQNPYRENCKTRFRRHENSKR
ncbi:MAG: DUF559 domain-containing protein [Oscillospiraceae bacterium]|nr:DUF559 domain-containing protein [Oscillospiraceae bacterium]